MLWGTFAATVKGKSVTGDYRRGGVPRLTLMFPTASAALASLITTVGETRPGGESLSNPSRSATYARLVSARAVFSNCGSKV